MSKKLKSFEQLGKEVLGYETFTVFAVDLVNSRGQRGLKLLRIEDAAGQIVPVHEFIKNYHIEPRSLGIDYIGSKGYQVGNKIKVLRIKAKRKEQEQPQTIQK